MKVKELRTLLSTLSSSADIDISCDLQGNTFTDISYTVRETINIKGDKVYILFPEKSGEFPEDRYQIEYSIIPT